MCSYNRYNYEFFDILFYIQYRSIKAISNSNETGLGVINDMIEADDKPKKQEPPKENINEDEVLFKIWHIINAFDDKLYTKLISSDIKTMTDLKTKDLSELIENIDFESMNEYTTKEIFTKEVNKFKPTEYNDNEQPSSSSDSDSESYTKDKKKKRKKKNKKMKEKKIGFSVGGAKDINNFRLSIDNNKMPTDKSITYEGIFYDYYFDTGSGNEDDNDNDDGKDNIDDEKKPLFYPSYNFAKSKRPNALKVVPQSKEFDNLDPLFFDDNKAVNDDNDDLCYDGDDNDFEYFMTIGLNSNIKETDFKRKKLNLVIVLDISGSMSRGFGGGRGKRRKYGKRRGRGGINRAGSKMRVANEVWYKVIFYGINCVLCGFVNTYNIYYGKSVYYLY